MANTNCSLNSYSTALVLLPPPHIQLRVNPVRSMNDKSFPCWTCHITLLYPFVVPSQLSEASLLIRIALSKKNVAPFMFQLDKVAKFQHRNYDTFYLGTSEPADVQRVWSVVSSALGYLGRPFVPHLTFGQSQHWNPTTNFLQDKGQLLLDASIQWEVGSVVILQKSELEGGLMNIYEEIPFAANLPFLPAATTTGLHQTMYHWSSDKWSLARGVSSQAPDVLTLATYNVLSDDDHPIRPRLPQLLSALLSVHPVPDIVCLQEVTDEFLRGFYSELSTKARWPWCTHDLTSVLPGNHNIIFLSRESFGISWEYLSLGAKTKQAIILRLCSPLSASALQRSEGRSLIVAGVHLTAGLSSSQQKTKARELETLLTFLRDHHSESLWVIIGDTNIPTLQPVPESILAFFDDAWLVAHCSEDGGATFNPALNLLASETVKTDRSPQRYDRILLRRDNEVEVSEVRQFGHGLETASDHYGLTATLRFSRPVGSAISCAKQAVTPAAYGVSEEYHHPFLGPTISDEELQRFVRQEGGFPTETQQVEKAQVIAALQMLFSFSNRSSAEIGDRSAAIQPQSAVRFKFVPVGSVGLGVDVSDSDMDVIVVGNISPSTFWALARARLRKATSALDYGDKSENSEPTRDVGLIRFVKDASIPMMELRINNVHVDLQYCSGSKVLERWDTIQELPSADPVFLLPASSLRTLNAYRDMTHILRALPPSTHSKFRLAHRALKLFCVSHGIYSSRLGFLGGFHITLLLSRIALDSPPDISAMQLISVFLATYSHWNWANEAAALPGIGDETTYTRSPGREPMVILSVKRPVRNVVQSANKHTTSAIISVFKDADRLRSKGVPWSEMCGSGGICGSVFKAGFLRSHGSYIKVDLLFWGNSVVKARLWTRFMESRLPHLLVHLQTLLPDWNARFWPTRLVEGDSCTDISIGMQSFYLIGLDAPTEQTSTKGLRAALSTFEDKLQRDERFYDAAEMFVSISHIAPTQLPGTINSPPAWLDGGVDPDDVSDDEAEPGSSDEDNLGSAFSPISSKQKKNRNPQPLRGSSVTHIPAAKLRTSSDVYNRLLWDRELDTADYLIGYEDRFAGLKEMPHASWKRDIDDEAFVPFHRVVHFRRKSDGVLVWDRWKKIDLVFGSGAQGSGAANL